MNKNAILLTPFQREILLCVGKQRVIQDFQLFDRLNNGRIAPELAGESRQTELNLQCQLFAVRGLLCISKTPKGRTVYSATALLLKWKSLSSHHTKKVVKRSFPLKHLAGCLLASALVTTGCSSLPWAKATDKPSAGISGKLPPVPKYNPEGWLPPERMEQFVSPGKGAVYRYCNYDCPSPTPKLQRVVANTPSYEPREAQQPGYVSETIPSAGANAKEIADADRDAKLAAIVDEAEEYLRTHPLPATTTTQQERPSEPVPVSASPSPVAKAAPNPTQSPEPIIKGPTQTSTGIVFTRNQSLLNESGRRAVGELVAATHDAQMILLRGYSGSISPEDSEAFSKMSVARALAVRTELISNGVERSKIRILNPKLQLINSVNPDAPENRSVTVILKMPDGTDIKPMFSEAKRERQVPIVKNADVRKVGQES